MRAIRKGYKTRLSFNDSRVKKISEDMRNADNPTIPISYSGVADPMSRINHKTSMVKRGAGYESYSESFDNTFFDSIKEK